MMVVFPNAKINLGLFITGKRNDGYHHIETVLYPIAWCDVLEVIKNKKQDSSSIVFSSSGLAVPGNTEENLCAKAFRLLAKDFEFPSVCMHLHKLIPMGAGLGGGSSDAAYMLCMLNALFGLKLNSSRLKEYARRLGSDCAFFVENYPVLAYEKGDVFNPLVLSLAGYFLVVVMPSVHVNTAEAYAGVTPVAHETPLRDLICQPVQSWKDTVVNDFERTVFLQYPILAEIKTKLYDAGALYASMTGSGSALYGVFEKETDCSALFPGCSVRMMNIE